MEHLFRRLAINITALVLLISASVANVVYGYLATILYRVNFLREKGDGLLLGCYIVWLTLLVTLVPIFLLHLPKWLRIFRNIVLVSTVMISIALFVIYQIGAYQLRASIRR